MFGFIVIDNKSLWSWNLKFVLS